MNVVITGASEGIGAVLAQQLGARGDRVVLAARRERELNEVASRSGANAVAVPTDVTRRAQVEHLRDRALEAFGHIDVWVNNAGRGISKLVSELTDEEFDSAMTDNVKSALYGIQAVLPHFIARERGHVINVSSMLSRVPMASIRSAYSAAKAALNSLTANLRMDLAAAHPGIHVSLVIPGLVDTNFRNNARNGTPPIRPGGAPPGVQSADEVASAIVRVIDHPVAEVHTNPAHAAMAQRYIADVAEFEKSLRPPA
jgi:short-subunit dehydrogenase